MKTLLALLTIAVSIPVLALSARADDADLQGRWSIVSVPSGWKKIPGTSVVITPGEVKICLAKVPAARMTYKIDPERRTVESVRTVKGKPVVQLGTYRKEGDTLVLSVAAEGKPRPTSPDSTDGGAMRWVFRKTR
jgi:hypothetical protein